MPKGKPSPGTPKDMRLKENKTGKAPAKSGGKGLPFGGKKAPPFGSKASKM